MKEYYAHAQVKRKRSGMFTRNRDNKRKSRGKSFPCPIAENTVMEGTIGLGANALRQQKFDKQVYSFCLHACK